MHLNVLGPLHIESTEGYKYAMGFIDSHSRYGVVYLMHSRDKCFEKLQEFVADIGKPNILVTDGAK